MTQDISHGPSVGMATVYAPLGDKVGEFSAAWSSSYFSLVGVSLGVFQPGVTGVAFSSLQNSALATAMNEGCSLCTSSIRAGQSFRYSYKVHRGYQEAPGMMYEHAPGAFMSSGGQKAPAATSKVMVTALVGSAMTGIGLFGVNGEPRQI